MKSHLFVLIALAALFCAIFAYGCGRNDETTINTTQRETTAHTTMTMAATTKAGSTTITEPLLTSPITSDMALPDIDNPITDIEPNIPESGVGNGSDLPDMLDDAINGTSQTSPKGNRKKSKNPTE